MAVACSGKTNFVIHALILLFRLSWGRIHHVKLQDEVRQTIELSKFGFLKDGILRVNFSDMVIRGDDVPEKDLFFGFSLEKTGSDGISPYMEQHSEKCILMDQSALSSNANQISLAVIKFDLVGRCIVIDKTGSDFLNLTIDDKSTSIETVATMPVTSATSPVPPSAKQSTLTTVPSSQAASTSSSPKRNSTAPTTEVSNITASQLATTGSAPKSNSNASTSEVNNIGASQALTTVSTPKSNSTMPSSEGNSLTTGKEAFTTSVLKNNQSISTQGSVSSNEEPNSGEGRRKRRNADTTQQTPARREMKTLPLYRTKRNENVSLYKYSGNFVVQVKSKAEEGLYNLYFHNCPVSNMKRVSVAIQIDIVEKNGANFLSAGEAPLPYMFGVLSVLFFGTAIFWLRVLRKNREFTYKVHYLMFVLILLKSLDLMFQAICPCAFEKSLFEYKELDRKVVDGTRTVVVVNYHFISKDGTPAESWEVLYYITHLLKGALLFTTIVLIGTGYFFIKHVLSDRDKKIFMIVIPLQILANTAQIVMESTEEANTQYTTWKELFILVDLLCCGAILFPVVWSIRHLQEGSQTDGKAALNLAKLKLFRHFYVMIVCYIYFTRIIVYLIKITVPFQYMWLDDFFNNAASYVFFVLTGYKFRPAPDNPYLHVPQEDSDDEVQMEEVVTNAGLAEGITRLQPSSDGKRIFETA